MRMDEVRFLCEEEFELGICSNECVMGELMEFQGRVTWSEEGVWVRRPAAEFRMHQCLFRVFFMLLLERFNERSPCPKLKVSLHRGKHEYDIKRTTAGFLPSSLSLQSKKNHISHMSQRSRAPHRGPDRR